MTHRQRMAPRLSALLDGDLGRARAALLRRHVARCVECQGELTALAALQRATRSLGGPVPRPAPTEFLTLRAQLGPPSSINAPPRGTLLRPALLMTAAGATALCGILWLRPAGLSPTAPGDLRISLGEEELRRGEEPYQQALAELERLRTRRKAGPDADLRQAALTTQGARATARSRPADLAAQERLYQAYWAEIAAAERALDVAPPPAAFTLTASAGAAP